MVLIKMRLLIFLVVSRYGLSSKNGIIFQRSIYNWSKNQKNFWIWCDIFCKTHKMFFLTASNKLVMKNNPLMQLLLIFYKEVNKTKLKVWKFQRHRNIDLVFQ